MKSGLTRHSLLILFALSGFSGLIYESVWSHYLKLFLGHSAYAQALVLVIFMGGMAIGAWLISRVSHKITNLLLGYAIIEGLIGLFGLVFHNLFEIVNTFSFAHIIPALDPSYVFLYKFMVASILILPQSILLGTTFPLMCGGFIRKYPSIPGKSISLLYFSNSLGAALGLLVSTFYLIGKLGLPGTIFTAGLINIGIAILVYGYSKHPVTNSQANLDKNYLPQIFSLLFLTASFFTGMASFIYEVAWIRMLSMVLGSSTHSFELMLSAFITGLAIGGYWIRKQIDTINDTVKFAGIIQIVMGLFAFSTIFLYSYSFEIMSFLVRALDKTDQGYILFNISGQLIAMLIMLPTTICAGMTLPLFTFALLKQGHGEKSVGLIYSSNTIGAIFGVVFTVFIGMPALGLKNTILAGATIDIVIGLVFLMKCITPLKLKYPVPSAALFLLLFIYAAVSYDFDTKRMASGVFRHGYPEMNKTSEVIFHEDGKTASISVVSNNTGTILISTNGKPDASISMNKGLPPTLDEVTMKLLAAIPLSIYPGAKKIANIGMGSGLTTHIALTWQSVEQVDTIEIEAAMIEGARLFIPETEKTFNDPRSHIHIADAKTFFSTYQHKYDIIISEPSNPWVSGVSSLFTQEFYNSIKSNLNENGLFTQWIHTYEFNIDLFVSVLKSLSSAFPYYSIYFTDSGNVVLIASLDKPVPAPDPSIFDSSDMSEHLSQIHINNIQDINFRFLGDQDLYNPYIKHYPVPVNSDYYPILDLRAPKYRFLATSVPELLDIRLSSIPILDMLYDIKTDGRDKLTASKYFLSTSTNVIDAKNIYELFEKDTYMEGYLEYITSIKYLKSDAASCIKADDTAVWINSLFLIMHKTVAHLTPDQIRNLIDGFTPDCETNLLSEFQKDWLGFFESLGLRDIPIMVNMASRLLLPENQLTSAQKKYVITSLLTGLIKLREFEQAANLWNKDIAGLFLENGSLSLEIKLLLAAIDQQQTIGE